MNLPNIPGFLGRNERPTLASVWPKPDGLPGALWPEDSLQAISNTPVEWVTLSEHDTQADRWHAVACALVPTDQTEQALEGWDFFGSDLGAATIWSDGAVDSGLVGRSGDVQIEFFTQGREVTGASSMVLDISQPFLWYWDAYPVEGGWRYTDRAGRQHELLRTAAETDGWKVEVRALELRQYLKDFDRTLIIQTDTRRFDNPKVDNEVSAVFNNEWAHFRFDARNGRGMRTSMYSRALGRYAITGVATSMIPKHHDRPATGTYPTFIYSLDRTSGQTLSHSCDPDELGDYFHDDDRLHYLTPVYFRREVLQPYDGEPHRYHLTMYRVSCLNLWGIPLSFNSAGLVEVYLGDLGTYLPPEEWGHWTSYNVPPEGKMDEGRYKRDFLSQWASSPDPPGELQRAREEAASVSAQLLGSPLWKPLTGDIAAQWRSLLPPLTDDPTALAERLLTMTKSLVDGIDTDALKEYLSFYEKGEQSLGLLKRLIIDLGGDDSSMTPLRKLQAFRSAGGVAHLAGSGKEKATAELGITGLDNVRAFEVVAAACAGSLAIVNELLAAAESAAT